MQVGTVFDIREFTVHDGPGIRTTVFLKGCPLRCAWCHNPEGISPCPQTMQGAAGKRIMGKAYRSGELAAILNRQGPVLGLNGGGVTFSGGEPLAQASFLAELIGQLHDIHVLLDTSGYAVESDFISVAAKCDLVYFDLKLIDPALHRRFTGVDNSPILHNLSVLAALGVPFVIRVPLIPGITDTDENLQGIARTVAGLSGLVRVDLLPYNRAAGGKYASLRMPFHPPYEETRPVHTDVEAFMQAGIPVRIAGTNVPQRGIK